MAKGAKAAIKQNVRKSRVAHPSGPRRIRKVSNTSNQRLGGTSAAFDN